MYLLSDPISCWLVVDGATLRKSGFQPSSYSWYEPNRDIYYLEPDRDAPAFNVLHRLTEGIVNRQINSFEERIRRHGLVPCTTYKGRK